MDGPIGIPEGGKRSGLALPPPTFRAPVCSSLRRLTTRAVENTSVVTTTTSS